MVGAHLDSWHAGTGSNDNGAGCAVMMEAMRILKATGPPTPPHRPHRDCGRAKSRACSVRGPTSKDHFATRGLRHDDPKSSWSYRRVPARADLADRHRCRITRRFSAYFNLDNGSGKIRGVYAQSNARGGADLRSAGWSRSMISAPILW